jgi:hypothetical protein
LERLVTEKNELLKSKLQSGGGELEKLRAGDKELGTKFGQLGNSYKKDVRDARCLR